MRNAISRRRPLKRTSNKFATLLQAIIKTAPTAISSVTKAGRKSPVTSSVALTSTDVQVQSAVSDVARDSFAPRRAWSTALAAW
jgi:hypothetical protein